jgi:DNA-binding NarL/FixJ family response regulator/class 3 adenylate cyclase
MPGLPSGIVTFLFTDIEGSSRLWERYPLAMRAVVAQHDALLRAAVEANGGVVVKATGDGFHAVFADPIAGVAAAIAVQSGIRAASWGEAGPPRVRVALHTAANDERDGDYYGPEVNRAARLMAIAQGGQVLLSQTTAVLVRRVLAPDVSLRDLGEVTLKDLPQPEHVFQLVAPGLPADFAFLSAPVARVGESTPASPPVRVLVVDDQRLMRDGIASLLGLQPGLRVVGTAANGQQAVDLALGLRPDVVLMDVRMPVLDGVAATAEVRRQLPSCQVLMLTTFDDEDYVVAALRAGAAGYLLKDLPAPDLARAIESAHRGLYQLDPSVAAKVLHAATRTNPPSAPPSDAPSRADGAAQSSPRATDDLTAREIEVLRLIAKGATNREIAEKLVITEGTVKNHISNILSRLGLRDRTLAALYAREAGLLETT